MSQGDFQCAIYENCVPFPDWPGRNHRMEHEWHNEHEDHDKADGLQRRLCFAPFFLERIHGARLRQWRNVLIQPGIFVAFRNLDDAQRGKVEQPFVQ
jgi:hypothetical protein